MFLKIKSDKVFLPMSFMNYSDFKKQGDYSLIQQTPTEFGQWIGRLSRNSPSRQIQLKLPWELFERAAELGLAKAAGVSRAEREGGVCGRRGGVCVGDREPRHTGWELHNLFAYFSLGNSSNA